MIISYRVFKNQSSLHLSAVIKYAYSDFGLELLYCLSTFFPNRLWRDNETKKYQMLADALCRLSAVSCQM